MDRKGILVFLCSRSILKLLALPKNLFTKKPFSKIISYTNQFVQSIFLLLASPESLQAILSKGPPQKLPVMDRKDIHDFCLVDIGVAGLAQKFLGYTEGTTSKITSYTNHHIVTIMFSYLCINFDLMGNDSIINFSFFLSFFVQSIFQLLLEYSFFLLLDIIQ